MNFNQYECGGGIAVPVNPWNDPIYHEWPQYHDFQTWLQSQPTIHCDPELDGVYPVGEFKTVWQNRLEYNHCGDPTDYEWTSENENAYRHFKTFAEYETHGKSLGFETRIYIEHTGSKQPVSEPEHPLMPCCKKCGSVLIGIYETDLGCCDGYCRGIEFPKPATPEQKGVEQGERFYTESEVKLIATRFARQSRLMNDITSNDTINSFDNWFNPKNFNHTQQ